jgi:hypothetical protein
MAQTGESESLSVQVIENVSGLEDLGAALKEIDRRHPPETVYQSGEFLVPWLSCAARRSSLRAIVLRDGAGARAVLPLVCDEVRRGPFRVSRMGLPTHEGHPPALDIRAGEKDAPAAAVALLSAFTERGAHCDVLSLGHLSGNSSLLRALPDMCRRRGLVFSWRPARRESFLLLEGDWDSYLARLKRHHRKEINRGFRRIEEVGEWKFIDEWPREDGVQQAHERYLNLVRGSWKTQEAGDEEFVLLLEKVMRSFARRGDLLVSWLSGPDGDGAALIQLRKGKLMAAFHQAYASVCPVKGAGTELLGHAIRRAYEEGAFLYDFSTSAGHIHRWNPLYRNTCHVYVTKRTPAGWLVRRRLMRERTPADDEGSAAAASESEPGD